MLRHPPLFVTGRRTMESWNARVAAVWDDDTLSDAERIDRIDALAGERAEGDARALFERAGARDSAGEEAEAEVLYRRALDAGLDDEHRPQAVIQLASTLRNLGEVDEALGLLRAERERGGPLTDAASAFYALALVTHGESREAAAIALEALAPHLPRYTRSVTAYARELVDPPR
jgi:tetratricopeptide (TPR) repeat protein